jgi:hypothetical protein
LACIGVLHNYGAGGGVSIYRALPGLASPVDLEGGTSCGSLIQIPRGMFSKDITLDPMKDLDMTIRLEGMVTA